MSSAHIQQPIRALFVLDQVNRGGIEMQALDALKASQGSGIEITVVTTGGQLLSEFRKAGDVVVLDNLTRGRRENLAPALASGRTDRLGGARRRRAVRPNFEVRDLEIRRRPFAE